MKYGDLTGKVALVTGAARGLGESIAQVLAEYGAEVVVADIDLKQAEATSKRLCDEGLAAYALQVDVASKESVDVMIDAVHQRSGRLEILVNNAGILDQTPIPDLTVEAWDRVIDIDLRGTHLCSQAALPLIMQGSWGRIVNISSQAGQLGGFLAGVNYSAAKGGVLALTKAYARYTAKHNITVNCVSPGFMSTEMTQGRSDNSDVVPLGRLGTPLDTAKAVYFLASDLSDYITGMTIDLNGGYYMR